MEASGGYGEKALKKLRQSQTGKKSSITQRIQHIQRLVDEGGSRKTIKTLLEGLEKVYIPTWKVI